MRLSSLVAMETSVKVSTNSDRSMANLELASRHDIPVDWESPVTLVRGEHPVGPRGENAPRQGLAFLVRLSMHGDREEIGIAGRQFVDQAAEAMRKQNLVIQFAAIWQLHDDQPPTIGAKPGASLLRWTRAGCRQWRTCWTPSPPHD
jgi:hypothetical protein